MIDFRISVKFSKFLTTLQQ